MSSASAVQSSKTTQPQPVIDKTLIGGTIAGGITGAVLFGGAPGFLLGAISAATGYLAGKENITGSVSRFTSFVGKAIVPAVFTGKIKDLNNFASIASTYKAATQHENNYNLATHEKVSAEVDFTNKCSNAYGTSGKIFQDCVNFLKNNLLNMSEQTKNDPDCEKACRAYDSLYRTALTERDRQLKLFQKAEVLVVEALHNRQSAIAWTTGAIGAAGSLYCAAQTRNAIREGRKLQAAGWFAAGLANGCAGIYACLKNRTLQAESYFYSIKMKENNPLLNQLAVATGLSASLYSAYKTAAAFKENKLLETLQWFALTLGSGTLAYAAANMPDVK